jgi:hypothetical protein
MHRHCGSPNIKHGPSAHLTVLMASGVDPVLIRTQSVLDGPYGAAVRDSLSTASVSTAHPVQHLPFVETSQSHLLEEEPMNEYD